MSYYFYLYFLRKELIMKKIFHYFRIILYLFTIPFLSILDKVYNIKIWNKSVMNGYIPTFLIGLSFLLYIIEDILFKNVKNTRIIYYGIVIFIINTINYIYIMSLSHSFLYKFLYGIYILIFISQMILSSYIYKKYKTNLN